MGERQIEADRQRMTEEPVFGISQLDGLFIGCRRRIDRQFIAASCKVPFLPLHKQRERKAIRVRHTRKRNAELDAGGRLFFDV